MARNVAPNRCSNFDQISTPILTILELQNGTQNHSKISLRAQGPPRARPEASREPFGRHFGLILASIRSLRGLMFELFRGARLLLLACCSSIAGALFLLRPLLLSFEAHMPVSDAGPLHRGILGRSSNGLHWFEGTPSFRRRGRLREATPTRRHQRRRSCETECPTST